MDAKTVKTISKQVYGQFPEISGVVPKVRKQQSTKTSTSAKIPGQATYLLIYEARVELIEGKTISRWVRVTANGQGKILKVSTSR